MDDQVNFSRFTGSAENGDVARQQDPRRELRSPAELERSPDYYRRSLERGWSQHLERRKHGRRHRAGRSR